MENQYSAKVISTPIGPVQIICSPKGLQELRFIKSKLDYFAENKDKNPLLKNIEKQICEYFLKKRKIFNLPLDLKGTEFQKSAWQALCKIPYGQRVTYREQALLMAKDSKYARAVGGANHKNPIPIIVPCHRVLGSNGKLVGYAGGLKIKKALLALEAL